MFADLYKMSEQIIRGSNDRRFKIDLLKGWAIIGVIIVHMLFVNRFPLNILQDIRVLQHIFASCVLVFFFCSGFLYGSSSKLVSPIFMYGLRRARRLLVPWLLYWLLYKALLIAGHQLSIIPSLQDQPAADKSWVIWFLFYPSGPQLYFLIYLFLISIAFHALLQLNMFRQEWLLWLIVILLGQLYWLIPEDEPHGEEMRHLPAYITSYIAGFLLTRPTILSSMRLWIRRCLFLSGNIAYVLLCTQHYPMIHLAVPIVLFYIASFQSEWFFSPLVALGRRAGAIFVWHTPILMPGISIVLAKSVLAPWALIVVMIILTIGASLLVSGCVRRFDKFRLLTF
jgi:hypothetical protein